ncbi:SDR family oxidoreductase [Variovorax sp. NFACC27]|uniref:SDR family oxidoreductase n=1 Tax=Variovorax sp. NFACC27 TaxID=1566274 RepID=UPI003AB07D12
MLFAPGKPVGEELHPLVHRNTSSLAEQRFSSVFTGEEFFLADHVVKGQRVLPGVAYLELARAAVVQALELAASQARDVRLEQVVFAQPVVVGDAPVEVHIALVPQDVGLVSFEVYTQVVGEEEARVHAQGRARVAAAADAPLEDLGRLRSQCSQVFASEACYAEFARMGLAYGPAFQSLMEVRVGQDAAGRPMALGDVQMPSQGTDPAAFVLPPSLLDGALQASIGLVFAQPQDRLSLPFAVEAVELYGAVPEKAVAVVRQSEGSTIGDAVLKLDVSLVDAEGRVCVQLRGFSSRVLDSVAVQAAAPAPAKGEVETLLLRPTWQEAQLPAAEPVSYGAHWVVLCEVGGDAGAALKAALPQARCLHLSAEGADLSTRYGGYAAQLLAYLQAMFSEKPSGWVRVQLVVPASGEGALLAGLGGMLKSARQESPKLVIQVLGVEPSLGGEALAQCVSAEAQAFEEDVRSREVMRLEEVREDAEQAQALVPTPWKRGGVYLISGGAGRLGLLAGKAIATAVSDVTLVLTGRSVLGAEKLEQLRQLEALGARVVYRQMDVADSAAVEACVAEMVQTHGPLTGVIHTARVLHDGGLMKKTESELRAVLAPKVAGVLALDAATRDQPLEVFVSLAFAADNAGQLDRATADAFLNAYAAHRAMAVQAGERSGRTRSIDGPSWENGTLERALSLDSPRVTVLSGVGPRSSRRCRRLRILSGVRSRPPTWAWTCRRCRRRCCVASWRCSPRWRRSTRTGSIPRRRWSATGSTR